MIQLCCLTKNRGLSLLRCSILAETWVIRWDISSWTKQDEKICCVVSSSYNKPADFGPFPARDMRARVGVCWRAFCRGCVRGCARTCKCARARVFVCGRVRACVRIPHNFLILMRTFSSAAATKSMHFRSRYLRDNTTIGIGIFAIGSAVGGIKKTHDLSKRACDMLHIYF